MRRDPVTMQSCPDLVLTAAAVDRLRRLLDDSGDSHSKIRIDAEGTVAEPKFTFSFEAEVAPDDVQLDYALVTVLLDPETRYQLKGHEIDFREDKDGEYFVVRRAR